MIAILEENIREETAINSISGFIDIIWHPKDFFASFGVFIL